MNPFWLQAQVQPGNPSIPQPGQQQQPQPQYQGYAYNAQQQQQPQVQAPPGPGMPPHMVPPTMNPAAAAGGPAGAANPYAKPPGQPGYYR